MVYLSAKGAALNRLLNQLGNPPPYYSQFPNALQVLAPQLNWVETKDGPCIYVTGILTNRSAIVWQGIELECRFFDANGTLIDAANATAKATVRPNDDSAFRVVVLPGAHANAYRSLRISVSSARNDRASF